MSLSSLAIYWISNLCWGGGSAEQKQLSWETQQLLLLSDLNSMASQFFIWAHNTQWLRLPPATFSCLIKFIRAHKGHLLSAELINFSSKIILSLSIKPACSSPLEIHTRLKPNPNIMSSGHKHGYYIHLMARHAITCNGCPYHLCEGSA